MKKFNNHLREAETIPMMTIDILSKFKYPRTPHLRWSSGHISDDDLVLKNTHHFTGKQVVVTEKLDGENTSIYKDYLHARSLNFKSHLSRDWIKKLHANISHLIPEGWRLCGENLYAGDSKKLANQINCFLPPPGGNCTFPPGVPPPPCAGVPPGMVVDTGQSTVKVDGQTALGEGCKFMCPLFAQPVTLSKSDQAVAKHDEASSGYGVYIAGGALIVGTALLALAFLPEEILVAGGGVVVKVLTKVGAKGLEKIVNATKKLFKKSGQFKKE